MMTVIALGIIILLAGLCMFAGGSYLITLGGSWYFALAGLGMTLGGLQLVRRRASGAVVFLLVFLASIVWSVWDVGFAFWPLFSRLMALAVLALFVLLAMPWLRNGEKSLISKIAYAGAAVLTVALSATFYAVLQPQPIQTAEGTSAPVGGKAVGTVEPAADWRYFGRTPSGTRHQTTAENWLQGSACGLGRGALCSLLCSLSGYQNIYGLLMRLDYGLLG
jgi:quinate dehydrogenase (quinone)